MKREEFIDKIKEIGTLEDIESVRANLTELSEQMSTVFDEREELKNKNEEYIADMETLRKANMKLFLQVGDSKTKEEIKNDQLGKNEEVKEPRKFEDLFNEKGELK